MKIIITEDQQLSAQNKLKDMVKKFGWEDTAELVNGPENLAKIAFNDDPMAYLNMFNDLDVVEDGGNKYYKTKKGENVMVFRPKTNKLYIQRDFVSFIKEGFGYDYYKIYELTKDWVNDSFKIKGVSPDFGFIF